MNKEGLVEITVTLSEKEEKFLRKIMQELKDLQKKDATMEDAVHECIRMATYDESEETAAEEGM